MAELSRPGWLQRAGFAAGRLVVRLRGRGVPPGEPRRFLLVKTHAAGDILMVTPAIRLLRRLRPEAELVFLTGRSGAPLLEGNPHLDRVLAVDEEGLLAGRAAAARLAARRIRELSCSAAVLFHPAWPVHLLAWKAGIPRRFGFDGGSGSGFALTDPVPWRGRNDFHYVVGDYLRLAAAAGGGESVAGTKPGGRESLRGGGLPDLEPGAWDLELHLGEEEEQEAERILESCSARGTAGAIGIAPGGGVNPRDRVERKRWAPERFALLGDRLAAATGRPVWIFGGPGDREAAASVKQRMSAQAVDLSGLTTLRSLGALIRRASLLVTGDSAPLHIALALGVPLVALFGPTRASALLPLSHPRVRMVASRRECSPCYNNEAFPGCTQAGTCMEGIEVEEVLERALDVLAATGRAGRPEGEHAVPEAAREQRGIFCGGDRA